MKRLYSKDLGIIFLLTAVYIILTSFPNFNFKDIFDIIFFVLFFLFTGYSLIALIRPEEEYKDILHKPVLLLEFSVLVCLAVSIVLKFSYLGLHLRSVVMVLSIIIMVMSISAYIRRINHFRSSEFRENYETEQIAEVSESIKELTKSSVQMEETSQKEQTNTIPEQEQTESSSKSKNLVVAENHIKKDSIKHLPPVDTSENDSKPKIGNLKLLFDLILIEVFSIFIIVSFFVKTINIGILHYFSGLIYMLFLVGYPLVKILFPKRNSFNIKILVGLSVGLSLPISSIVGLVLNSTKYGISIYSMLPILVVLTLLMSLFAIKRVNSANR